MTTKEFDPSKAINLDFNRVFCARHGEPLRPRWPAGYPIMVVKLFEAVFFEKATLAEAREASGKDKPDIEAIHELLDKEPACCRVSDAKLIALYKEAKFGVVAKCKICRKKREGSPYQTRFQKLSHVCFECVVHNMTPIH